MADGIDITLIDKSDGFVFGYSKLDMLFGRQSETMIQNPYAAFAKPGVRLLRETITAIDAEAKRVTTDKGLHEADILVIALGADYDVNSTPGCCFSLRTEPVFSPRSEPPLIMDFGSCWGQGRACLLLFSGCSC
jgi:NADH dehydrogenase FAD-containing subunit